MKLCYMPELRAAIKILTELNNEVKGEGLEVVMPYLRKVSDRRNKYLAKGRKKFQKAMGYKAE